MKINFDIQPEDLPEDLAELAEVIGFLALLALVDVYGGGSIYINKWETVARGARDRRIRAAFTGTNYRELARDHSLTESRIRDIVGNRKGKKERSDLAQMELFEEGKNNE